METRKSLSRRSMLQLSASALAGMVAVACGATPTATPAPTATTAPKPAATTAPAAPTTAPAAPAATATSAPKPAATTAPVATPASGAKVSIQFWTRLGAEKQPPAISDEWNKAHPETQVVYQGVPGADYRTKLLASVAGGNPPDVVGMDIVLMPVYTNQNAVLAIDEFLAAEGPAFKNDFKQGLWASTVDTGKTYAIPWWSDPSALFFNVEMATQAGFPKGPQTWDDLKAIAKSATKTTNNPDTDVYGAIFPVISPSMFTFLPFLWSAGADLLDEKGCAGFNNAGGASVLQLWTDLFKNGWMPRSALYGTDGTALANIFASGRAAMWVGSPSILNRVAELKPDLKVGVVPMPGPTAGKQSSFLGGDNLVIMKATKFPKQSWDFMKFPVGAELMRRYALASNGIYCTGLMTRTSAYTPEYLQKFPIQESLQKTAEVGKAPFASIYLTEARVPLYNAMQAAMGGQQTVEKALAEAEPKSNLVTGCKK